MKPTVYVKDQCQGCTATKRKLEELGIQYDTADLTIPANIAAAKELGHIQAPVVVWGDEHWSGYRPDMIQQVVDRLNREDSK